MKEEAISAVEKKKYEQKRRSKIEGRDRVRKGKRKREERKESSRRSDKRAKRGHTRQLGLSQHKTDIRLRLRLRLVEKTKQNKFF